MLQVFAVRPLVLFLSSIGILIGIIGICALQVDYLINNYNLSFIPGEVQLEENIAIVIAAFGVFLDNRHRLVRAVYGENPSGREVRLSALCKEYGFSLVLLGVFIEIVDLCFLAMNSFGIVTALVEYAELSLLFFLNIFALALVARFAVGVARR